jgi:hypothetical protein
LYTGQTTKKHLFNVPTALFLSLSDLEKDEVKAAAKVEVGVETGDEDEGNSFAFFL